jgi:glyoxylase I family protein
LGRVVVMEPEVIGIDHLYLSVRAMPASEAFYDAALMQVLGFRKNRFTLAGAPHVQFYNRQFGVVIRPARPATPANDSGAPGLHHLCLRVETDGDVARVAAALRAQGIDATPARLYPEYAPDYCATFFSDPDGVRLEVTNFRAERRERMQHWERGGSPDVAPRHDGGVAAVDLAGHVRTATPADCAPLAALIGELVAAEGSGGTHPPVTPARTEAVLRALIDVDAGDGIGRHHHLLVAAEDAQVVGYLAVHWIPLSMYAGSEAYVSDLYLSPRRRGAGLGKQLIAAVERLATARGCLRLMLNNRVTSQSYLRQFYPKLGFQRRDEYANFVKTLAAAKDPAP